MANPDFSISDVLEWARTKPANERYDVTDADYCALGQFGTATGRDYLHTCFDPDRELAFSGLNEALGFNDHRKNTFGALVTRLEALLPTISDTWTRADAYLIEVVA